MVGVVFACLDMWYFLLVFELSYAVEVTYYFLLTSGVILL